MPAIRTKQAYRDVQVEVDIASSRVYASIEESRKLDHSAITEDLEAARDLLHRASHKLEELGATAPESYGVAV